MHYTWDFSVVTAFPQLWLKGAAITLIYAVVTILGGLVIGVLCAIATLYRRKWVVLPVYAYVSIFRCTPVLVQIVWIYYALPIVINLNIPAWLASGLGLTLYMGCFATEIVRAGIISIEKGQWNAARALGMTPLQMMRRIIMPQAFRRMVPPMVNQSVIQLKNTSLLYVVAVPDLMYTGSIIVADTFRPLEVYTSVAVMYYILLAPLTQLSKYMETRVDR